MATLEKKLEATKESIENHEDEIVGELNMTPGTVLTPTAVQQKMAQIVSSEQQKSNELNQALMYSNLEEQQPGYFSDLEAGLELAEEYSSRKR